MAGRAKHTLTPEALDAIQDLQDSDERPSFKRLDRLYQLGADHGLICGPMTLCGDGSWIGPGSNIIESD